MNLCTLRVFWLTIIIIVFTISIVYIYNVRIEGMKVKYDCPSSLEETSEGIFKVSYPNNDKRSNYYYSLEEYVKMIDWQNKNDITCPILAVETNKTVLQPSSLTPSNDEKIQLLLDANRDSNMYNKNGYPGFDPYNLYIGVQTPLDLMHNMEENNEYSRNPMDSNWGGTKYTKQAVDNGFYKENTRSY